MLVAHALSRPPARAFQHPSVDRHSFTSMYPHVLLAETELAEDFSPVQDGWNRSKTMKLIRAYQKHPVLYCPKAQADKKSPMERTDAFKRISLETGFPTAAVEKKVATLRSQYFREVAKIQRSRRTSREVYVPNWYAFELLAFLGREDRTATPGLNKLRTLLTRVSL